MSTSAVCTHSSLAQQGLEGPPLVILQHKQQQQQQLRSTCSPSTVPQMLIEDEVHGLFELPNHIGDIVRHALFQRLKKIKQTGLLSLAARPESSHTRYDHCIGTYKSAQDMLNALKRNSCYEPELPDWCRNAVEIAALLHDVGHGPFSHNWERVCGKAFDHEQNSLVCVDKIFSDMKSPELLLLRDENGGRGVQLIKALILGKVELLSFPMMKHGYIFDIVHNRRCGLDVDKWDYMRRDNNRLKILSDEEMQFDELFLHARISMDGQRIEYRYDDYHLIYKLYVARWKLHVQAYQLPITLAFDKLLSKIVQRSRPDLIGVYANNDQWCNFYDDHVLQLIDIDPLSVYLRSAERCVETTSCEHSTDDCICVISEKLGPGVDMSRDDCYALYGDERKKRSVDRLLTSTPIIGYFKLI